MAKRFIFVLLAIIFLLLLALCVAWWSGPRWMPQVIQEVGERAGLQLTVGDLGRPGLTGWRFPQVIIEGKSLPKIELTDVVLNWKCCDSRQDSLTLSVELINLNLEDFRFGRNAKSGGENKPSPPFALSSMMNIVAQRVPFVSARVSKLRVKGALDRDIQGSLRLTRDRNAFEVNAEVESHSLKSDSVNSRIKINWQAPMSAGYSLQVGESEIQGAGQLRGDGTWLFSGKYSVRPVTPASQFLHNEIPVQIQSMDLTGEWEGIMPDVWNAALWQIKTSAHIAANIEEDQNNARINQNITVTLDHDGGKLILEPNAHTILLADKTTDSLEFLPQEWVLSIKDSINCDLVFSEPYLTCSKPMLFLLASAPIESGVSEVSLNTEVIFRNNWRDVDLQLEGFVDSRSDKLPRKLELGGKTKLRVLKEGIAANFESIDLSWTDWKVAGQSLESGKLSINELSVDYSDVDHWQLNGPVKAETTLSIFEETIRPKVEGILIASPKQIAFTKANFEALDLITDSEILYVVSSNQISVDINAKGELRKSFIDNVLKQQGIKAEVTPGESAVVAGIQINSNKTVSLKGESTFSLKGWDGMWGGSLMQDAAVQGSVVFDQNGLSMEFPLKVSVDSLDVGVPIRRLDSESTLKLDWSSDLKVDLNLNTLSSDLFGGQIALVKPAHIKYPNMDETFLVEIRDLPLNKLVELENKKVAVSGTVAGIVPVRIKDSVVLVEGGQVAAQDHGRIQLREAAEWRTLAGSNEQLLFAVNALEDFHYKVLTSRVDFTEDGLLQLGVSMQGNNPKVERGRDILYNLNVESNIFSLLKSLKMADDISKQLESAVER